MATAIKTTRTATDDRSAPVKVLVVGQTPPPYHGQAVMIERLVRANMDGVRLYHVRMAFSHDMAEVGRFRFRKVAHLVHVVWRILYVRFVHGARVLYYPPAGPNRIPMLRDMFILLCTRWLFRQTIFHMQASGLSELYQDLDRACQFMYRLAYFHADAVVRTSPYTTDDAHGLRARREFIVTNAADDHFARFANQRSRARSDARATKLLYLSTVCRNKGILELLDACHRLRQQGFEFQLDVVGSFQPDEFQTEVIDAVRSRELDDLVRLHGQLAGDQKLTAFAAADIFCFPTFYESEAFPCAVVEAMSFALPVVAARWRGLPSIVKDGQTGFLVAPRDVGLLAQRMGQLMGDRVLRRKMGDAARKRFLQEFTTGRHLAAMKDVFVAVGRSARDAPSNPRSPREPKRSRATRSSQSEKGPMGSTMQ